MSEYFSPARAASYIELVGNAAVLSGMDFTVNVSDILKHRGTFPKHLFPAAIHEATHHYCFSMPVGHALSACFFEAVSSQHASATDPAGEKRYVEALMRYDIVNAALRPIAEGIALFAEFDATPGESLASISPPLSDMLRLFGGHLDDSVWESPTLTLTQTLQGLLGLLRDASGSPLRRETLLTEPLLGGESGYLTGYWLVKNWRTHLCSKQNGSFNKFLDSDFYLQFLANYFYADLQLASLILDFENYAIEFLDGLGDGQKDFLTVFIEHFYARLEHLVFDLESSGIDRLELALANANSSYSYDDVQIPMQGLSVAPFHDFQMRIEAMASRFQQPHQPQVGSVAIHVLNCRRWMAYASFETSVRVDENGKFYVGEGQHTGSPTIPVIFGTQTKQGINPGTAKGVVEFVRDINGGVDAYRRLIWRGNELIASLDDYNHQDDLAQQSVPTMSSASIRLAVKMMTTEVRGAFDSLQSMPTIRQALLDRVRNRLEHPYGHYISQFLRKDGIKPSEDDMKLPFYRLCDGDIDALKIVAKLGHLRDGMELKANIEVEDFNTLKQCPVELFYELKGNLDGDDQTLVVFRI